MRSPAVVENGKVTELECSDDTVPWKSRVWAEAEVSGARRNDAARLISLSIVS
jgi:hypothetical protein